MSSTLRPPRIPALLTRMSTPRKVSRTRATIAATCVSSVRSQVRPSASPPRLLIQSAHWCAFSGTTSTHATAAPSSASPCAMPPPMLGLVPVTMATLPASFIGGTCRSGGLRRRPRLHLGESDGDAIQRHLVRRQAIGVPIFELGVAPAEVLGDHETTPLDHLGVGPRELLRRVVALVEHDRLVLAREVVLDDPAVQRAVEEPLPETLERALRPEVVVVPDPREVLFDRDAHARVEVPRELGAEHAGEVMAAAPARHPRWRDVAPSTLRERSEEPRPEAAVVRLRPAAPIGVHVELWALSQVRALAHVAAEAVADEDRVLALRAARDEASARDHQRVAMDVVDVGVHRVLERDLPVAAPVD